MKELTHFLNFLNRKIERRKYKYIESTISLKVYDKFIEWQGAMNLAYFLYAYGKSLGTQVYISSPSHTKEIWSNNQWPFRIVSLESRKQGSIELVMGKLASIPLPMSSQLVSQNLYFMLPPNKGSNKKSLWRAREKDTTNNFLSLEMEQSYLAICL